MSNQLWTVYPALWLGETAGSSDNVIIEDIQSIGWTEGSDIIPFFADGNLYPQFGYMENIVPTATLKTTDLSVKSSIAHGKGGQLGLFTNKRTKSGYGTGETDEVVQCVLGTTPETDGECILDAINDSVSQSGESSLDLVFTAHSADGTTAPLSVTMINGNDIATLTTSMTLPLTT